MTSSQILKRTDRGINQNRLGYTMKTNKEKILSGLKQQTFFIAHATWPLCARKIDGGIDLTLASMITDLSTREYGIPYSGT